MGRAVSPDLVHRTEIAEMPEMQMTSVSCSGCGWSHIFPYARPETGRAATLRLARLRAELHEEHPDDHYEEPQP
jgi:RNase P subunit RPR2